MMVPFIVILPGLLGLALLPFKLVPESAGRTAGQHSYNEVLPLMLARYCGPGLLGLGITALVAGFMSGMAGNVSAFATVWTYDIYEPFIRQDATDAHYVSHGALVFASWSVREHRDGLPGDEFLQHHCLRAGSLRVLHCSHVRHGDLGYALEANDARCGILGAAGWHLTSFALWVWVRMDPGALRHVAFSAHAKDMAENVYRAMWSLIVNVVVTVAVSLFTKPKPEHELRGLVYGLTELAPEGHFPFFKRPITWAAAVAVGFVLLNVLFW